VVETILSALSPVVVTLLLGFVAAWRHDFGTKDASILNRMVLLYAVPIALFVGTVGTPRGDLVQDVPFAITVGVAIVGVYALAFLLFRFLFRFSQSECVLAALAASAPAAPFMGTAILGDLFGKASAVSIAIAALVINLLVVPVTILGLGLGTTSLASTSHPSGHGAFAEKLLETAIQPIVWAPLLAFVVVLCDVSIPQLLRHALSLLGQASGGVALFASGVLPAPYAGLRHPGAAHDLRFAAAFRCRQDNPRPPHMLLPTIAIRYHRRQSLPVAGAHLDADPLAHPAASHRARRDGIL